MLNNILLAAAVTIPTTPYCAPILAKGDVESPIPAVSAPFGGMTSALGSYDGPPSMAVTVVATPNAITCRQRARAKYFELGATDMSKDTENAQWGTFGNIQSLVWCRGPEAVISVAGRSFDAAVEIKDELKKAF